jgi:hypothetical protein
MLSIDQLKAQVESRSGRVLDVRTPADFNGEQGHIAGAVNLPLEELPSRLADLGADHGQRFVLAAQPRPRPWPCGQLAQQIEALRLNRTAAEFRRQRAGNEARQLHRARAAGAQRLVDHRFLSGFAASP